MSALATKLNFEHLLGNSEPNEGYREDRIVLPQSAWRNGADGTVLTGASTPAVALLTISSVSTELVQWAANAANTVIASAQFVMPADYGHNAKTAGTRYTDDLILLAKMRRQRNAADAAAWNARLAVSWFTPGTDSSAFQSLTTGATVAIPTIGADNTGTLTGFSELTFDIGARLRAESKQIKAGDVVRLVLGPDAANANAALQLAGALVRLRRHACTRDRSLR